jgi:G3E family GTPase
VLVGIPVNLITGQDAAAKSRLVGELLRARPRGARWAVLVNDDGVPALPEDRDGIYVSEVMQGCICCTAQLPLRVGITRLLREAEPDRLLIQTPSQARTKEVLRMLADRWLAPVLSLRATIHVISARTATAVSLNETDGRTEQLAASQVIALVDDTDAGSASALKASRHLERLFPAVRVLRWQLGRFDLAALDIDGRAPAPRFWVDEPTRKS